MRSSLQGRALATALSLTLTLPLMLASPAAGQQAREAEAAFPAVTLPGTQVRSMKSAATGRDYDLYIQLPAGRVTATARRYPVLYVLDGQWDFKLMSSIQGGLLYDRFVPEMIIVGITYSGADANYDALRAMDYTPVAEASVRGSGDAPRFLAFVRQQLVPLVESSFRADPARRVLMGSSYGGLFTLYALFHDPAFFSGYIAGSPAVPYANGSTFTQEAAYAASHKELPVRLFIAVGSAEPLAQPVQEFARTVAGRGYAGLRLETRVIEGERHSGNKPEAFNRGLRFIFQ